MSRKTALVTGGTTGIGLAIASQLARKGLNVVISGRRESEGLAAVRQLQQEATGGAAVRFMRNDVTVESDVKAMFDGIASAFGTLDYAVNNAGTALETKPLADTDSDAFRQVLDVNVLGLYYCMKEEIRRMLGQGGGSIVNMASAAGLNGMAWVGPYAATKHAVVGLTRTAALEYATQNLRVNAVAPGTIRTERIEERIRSSGASAEAVAAMHPMQRLGTPEEVAHATCWLLSDEASFVTGHVLSVDGGLQAR
ncbi:SDR family NAD(P)-dependent oxidoreductase [Paracidovorax anthurii]|uniref:NAD(P)-dependent dehydrogenase (Short-subunit alcohol dehydrogenase family) n=1 Tax=Paracidovorax anthurii TaxID=78229 RepID=A0A328ZK89_9BURK|nr:glucose 1-dehydrogenase [Paracidovorax anthurii]RAR86568.1 NAD(P)-dependent dehydrogenase (short-subunit alcohol dehydrogenase family) [Paracidovorax anthurii]